MFLCRQYLAAAIHPPAREDGRSRAENDPGNGSPEVRPGESAIDGVRFDTRFCTNLSVPLHQLSDRWPGNDMCRFNINIFETDIFQNMPVALNLRTGRSKLLSNTIVI